MTSDVEEDRWFCIQCSNTYDKDNIELRLVEAVQRRSTRFQLQDLRCLKCHKVRSLAALALSRPSRP